MPKIFLYFFIITWFCCCTAKKERFLVKETQLSLPELDTSLPKDKGLWLLAAESRLQKLAALPDSLAAYVLFNKRVCDSVKQWKGDKAGGKYQDNIIALHQKAIGDTALKKILIDAYAWWGFDHFTTSYNDTVVSRLEQFLMLTRDRLPVHDLTIYAYQQLGIQYNVLGDLKKCGYYNTRFAELAKAEGNIDWYASGIANTSIALNELGLYDSTISLTRPVLNEKGVNPKRTAALYANLAEAEAGKKNFTESLNSAKKSLEILDMLTPKDIDSADLLELRYRLWWNTGNLQMQAKNYPAAINSLHKALAFLIAWNKGDTRNREAGKLYISIGKLHEQTGKLHEALHSFQMALHCVTNVDSNTVSQLPGSKDLYVENTIMEALDAKATVLQSLYIINKDTGLLKQAVACYMLAFEAENKLTRGFSYDESLHRQTIESKARSEKAIAVCYELSVVTRSPAWVESAFFFAERSKAVVLQESIRRNIAANGILLHDTNWLHVQQAQQLANFYERKIASVKTTDTTEVNQLKKKLRVAENDLLFAQTALVHSNSAYRELLLKADSLSIGGIKNRLLTNNTGLVEFFSGDSSMYIFSVSRNEPALFLNITNAVDKTLNTFLQFFTSKHNINNDPAAYQRTAFELYKQAGLDNIKNKDITRLLIIADGKFNFVPFEALITDTIALAGPKNFAYLLKNKRIDYGYSAATLLQLKEAENLPAAGNLVAFAPVFEEHERNLPPLIHAKEEMNAMEKAMPDGKYFLNANASIQKFKHTIANASIIHIASHASAGSTDGIQPRIEFYDSTLYLNEIYAMHINPRLVVLSACETGIGVLDKSEGAMSLARGFYYAGAQNVITSLWSADDRSTAKIFSSFYRDSPGDDYGESLYRSKLYYLEHATTANASPYYWAGFIHIGYTKASPRNNDCIFLIAIITIIILTFLVYRIRK